MVQYCEQPNSLNVSSLVRVRLTRLYDRCFLHAVEPVRIAGWSRTGLLHGTWTCVIKR